MKKRILFILLLTLLCGALYIAGMLIYKNYMEKKKK